MDNRNNYLYGRVRNELDLRDISSERILPADIYDALSQGQRQIFARIGGIEKRFKINLSEGKSEYGLVPEYNLSSRIIGFITPSTWTYKLNYVEEGKWSEVVKESISVSQPIYVTLFENKLIFYPSPTITGEQITVLAKIKSPSENISNTEEPILDEEWDDALEYYALYKLLKEESFFGKFEHQLKEIKNSTSNKGYPLQRSSVW